MKEQFMGQEQETGVDLNDLDLDELLADSQLPDLAQMDEYQASKVMRGIRSGQREAERLDAYKKRLIADVSARLDAKIEAEKGKIAASKELLSSWLKATDQTKISFPGLGTVNFSSSEKAEYDEDVIWKWLDGFDEEGRKAYVKTEEKLDKTALKTDFKSGEKIPGVRIWKEQTFVAKLEK
jgi:phage host-nuclease inhibitor protein Gam